MSNIGPSWNFLGCYRGQVEEDFKICSGPPGRSRTVTTHGLFHGDLKYTSRETSWMVPMCSAYIISGIPHSISVSWRFLLLLSREGNWPQRELSSHLPKVGWERWALDPSHSKNDAISTVSLCHSYCYFTACKLTWFPLSLRECTQAWTLESLLILPINHYTALYRSSNKS